MAQSRSTMSCRSGASSRVTTFAPDAARCDLVRGEVLEEGEPSDDQDDREVPEVEDVQEDDEEDDVKRAEGEHRQEHAGRETYVAAESLAFHAGFH